MASQIPIRALTVRLNSSRMRRLYATVCFSVHRPYKPGREGSISKIGLRVTKVRTVLFTIELSDAVASFVILTEIRLLLAVVKGGIILPGRSVLEVDTGFALQDINCTRNSERMSETTVIMTRSKGRKLSVYLRRQRRTRRRKLWFRQQKASRREGFFSE